tara:strand:+ start:27829 stop:28467 length:639 start_codon:yes stop_codon:yes gene_type:complete
MILDGEEFVFAGQSDDHEITMSENGGPITLFLEGPIDVSSGQTILVLAGHYGGASEVEFRMAQPVDEQTVLGYKSGATDPFFLQEPSVIMIRPLMIPHGDLGDNSVGLSFKIEQNIPNRFGIQTLINYELNEATAVYVEFRDAYGRIVKSIERGVQNAGHYSLEIDATEFADGIYFYSINIGGQKVTKRMVIKKVAFRIKVTAFFFLKVSFA